MDSITISNRQRAERAAKLAITGSVVNPLYVSLVKGQLPIDYQEGTGEAFGAYEKNEGGIQLLYWDNEWKNILDPVALTSQLSPKIKFVTSNYSPNLNDFGYVIYANSASTITIFVEDSASLPIGFTYAISSVNTGNVLFSPQSVTVVSFLNRFQLAGRGATATITKIASGEFHLTGNLI